MICYDLSERLYGMIIVLNIRQIRIYQVFSNNMEFIGKSTSLMYLTIYGMNVSKSPGSICINKIDK